MLNWIFKKKNDHPSDKIKLSKLRKNDILLLQFNDSMDVEYDFNKISIFQIVYLISEVYPIIKDSMDPRLDKLARTIFSLSMMPYRFVEQYEQRKLYFVEEFKYFATIEPEDGNPAVVLKIYPQSTQCLPCYIKDYGCGIIPTKKMSIEEAHAALKESKSIEEFNKYFCSYLTHPKVNIDEEIDFIAYTKSIAETFNMNKYPSEYKIYFENNKIEVEEKIFQKIRNEIDKGNWNILERLYPYGSSDDFLIQILKTLDAKNIYKSLCELFKYF